MSKDDDMLDQSVVTRDLESLRHLELPNDAPDSHLVRTSVLLVVIAIIAAIAGLVFSVVVLAQDKGSLESQLTCLRDSSVEYDRSIGEGINLLVDIKLADTSLLVGLADDDQAKIEKAIRDLASRTVDGEVIQANIDKAVKARESAAQRCR